MKKVRREETINDGSHCTIRPTFWEARILGGNEGVLQRGKTSDHLPAIRVGSLERLHRPNRFRVGYLSLKGGEGIHVIVGVDPGYLNAGLMKPRRGFTLVAGKEKLGVGKGIRAD